MSSSSPSRTASTASTSPALTVVAAAVLLFGVALRLLGMFSLELWSDEARWCEHLLTGTGTWFRPIGYMWVTKQLLLAFDVNEPLLRSLSTFSGIVQLPLVYVALRLITRRASIAVVGTWLVAIHPVAVAMSKEFKPYAVEAMLHSAVVAFALLYLGHQQQHKKQNAVWLVALLVTCVVAPFFAWTIVFAYPGVFVVVGWAALRDKRWAHLGATAVACVTTLGVLIAMFLARLATKKPATEYWGNKYDVFYVDDEGVLGQVSWFFEKTAELAAFPGYLELPWPPWLIATVKVASVVLCALGVVALIVRKDWRVVGLLLLPWLPMLLFNAKGAWPYGLFRTNTFMLFYTGMLVAIGIDFVVELVGRLPLRARARAGVAAVGALALVLTFPFELGAFAHKGAGTLTSEASVLAGLRRVYEVETGMSFDAAIDDETFFERWLRADAVRTSTDPRANVGSAREVLLDDSIGITSPLLVLDGHACTTMRYYRDYDSASSAVLEDWLPSHFTTLCGGYGWRGWMRTIASLRGRSFWLIASKTGWASFTREKAGAICEEALVDEIIPPSTHVYRCQARTDVDLYEPPPESPAEPPETPDE